MIAESKTAELDVNNGSQTATLTAEQVRQKTLISNINSCIYKLQEQEPTIENFPKEFLKFLEETLHIIQKGKKDAFFDFLTTALPKLFAKKFLKNTRKKSIVKIENNLEAKIDAEEIEVANEVESNTKILSFLAEKLQKAIQETIRKNPEKQPLTQLKEAFIQEIMKNMSNPSGYGEEQKQRWIRGIKDLLETLINSYHGKRLEQNNVDAREALNLYLGIKNPSTSTTLSPSSSSSSSSSSTSHSNLSERSLSPISLPMAAEVKTPSPRNDLPLPGAINALVGAICQKREITNPEMMETTREQLEEMCKTGLLGDVKIIVTKDFYKCFEDLIKATGQKKKSGDNTKAIEAIQTAFKNLCKLIGISEESTPGQAAQAIKRLSEKGGEFEYSALSFRKYTKEGSHLGNMAEYLQWTLPRELEKVATTQSFVPATEVESKTEALQPPLNLGKAINRLTGEICQQKGITDLEAIQAIRNMLTAECAEQHEVVEEITRESLLDGFTTLAKRINNNGSDKEGIQRRKEAFRAFCGVLHIDPNSLVEVAADRVKALLGEGGEFEYSTLQTLEIRIFDNPPQKLELFLREQLPKAFVEEKPADIQKQKSEQTMQPKKPENVSSGNEEEKTKTPATPTHKKISPADVGAMLGFLSDFYPDGQTNEPSSNAPTK